MSKPQTTNEKYEFLKELLRKQQKICVAFSGGTDSSFLLKTACDVLGSEHVLAVMLTGDMLLEREMASAKGFAQGCGAKLVCIHADVCAIEGFAQNSPKRCYHCKKALFEQILQTAHDNGYSVVCDGSNVDDEGDYRPGRAALTELNIQGPIAQAGLTKAEVRTISAQLGLATAGLPARACLATRIPYDTIITPALLKQIGRAEEYLLDLGFLDVRVRTHGNIGLIEVPKEELSRLCILSDQIVDTLKGMGYNYVCADLGGRRMGSLNEVLTQG